MALHFPEHGDGVFEIEVPRGRRHKVIGNSVEISLNGNDSCISTKNDKAGFQNKGFLIENESIDYLFQFDDDVICGTQFRTFPPKN